MRLVIYAAVTFMVSVPIVHYLLPMWTRHMTEMLNPPPSPVVELVRRHGGVMSHAALDPSRSIFRAPGIDGLICFLPALWSAAVLGDPVCAPEHKAALADAFAQ